MSATKKGLSVLAATLAAGAAGGLFGYGAGSARGENRAELYDITGVRAQQCVKHLGETATVGKRPAQCKGVLVHLVRAPHLTPKQIRANAVNELPTAQQAEQHFAHDIQVAKDIKRGEEVNYVWLMGAFSMISVALYGAAKFETNTADEKVGAESELETGPQLELVPQPQE